MSGRVHIVGAGLAGLAAAVDLVHRGVPVSLYEMAPHAGGRCRTFYDSEIDARIDNGNHLIMRGNRATLRYLAAIDTSDAFAEHSPARFPFVDVANGKRWTVRPSGGLLPWWLLVADRRPPGLKLQDALGAFRILTARNATVTDCVGDSGPAYRHFWEPLTVAALNTPPEIAAAALLRPVLLETFARGERYCRPMLARTGLGDALVDPALAKLKSAGADIRFSSRVRALESDDGTRVVALSTAAGRQSLEADDAVIVATPAQVTSALLPEVEAPVGYESILNAHFVLPSAQAGTAPITGVVGGLAQWVLVRDRIASVTVSCADHMASGETGAQARHLWQDVCAALDLGSPALPRHRLIREKRATPLQTPHAANRRMPTRTAFANAYIAGDWSATGLPATIESAIRSGQRAAELVLQRKKSYETRSVLPLEPKSA